MALTITFLDPEYGQRRNIINLPFPELPNVPIQGIIEVQADGNELEYIKEGFTNLPLMVRSPQTPGGLVVTWYGETAKFIVGNL